MAITQIRFNPNGGTIKAEIKFRTPQVGAYTLWLWEAGSNNILMEVRGNNENPADDIHPLPMPAPTNNGRILECAATLADPVGEGPYLVEMEITQDGNKLGTALAKGNMTNTSVSCNMFAKLTL